MDNFLKKSTLKEPGEKLVTVKAAIRNRIIEQVFLGGDFFIHPEEGIDVIEQALKGLPAVPDAIIAGIEKAVAAHGLELVGISPETIAKGITAEDDR